MDTQFYTAKSKKDRLYHDVEVYKRFIYRGEINRLYTDREMYNPAVIFTRVYMYMACCWKDIKTSKLYTYYEVNMWFRKLKSSYLIG